MKYSIHRVGNPETTTEPFWWRVSHGSHSQFHRSGRAVTLEDARRQVEHWKPILRKLAK